MRNYNAGELRQMNLSAKQDRLPNFRKNGQLYLVRCFVCSDNIDIGRENWAPAVASGTCAWCGWKEEKRKERKVSPITPLKKEKKIYNI